LDEENSKWADSAPAPVKVIFNMINMLSPSLPFADGVPNSGWIIPQPTTEGWRPHIATIKAWLHTLKLKEILHQPLASQFVVVYLLIVVVTLKFEPAVGGKGSSLVGRDG